MPVDAPPPLVGPYHMLTAARIAFHDEQLREIGRQTSLLQESLLLTLQDSQPATQEVSDTLRIDIHDLDVQARTIQNTIAYLGRRLNPRILHAFPTELLVAIFEELCTARSNVYDGFRCMAPYDVLRAKMPFVLSSVCRHWRRVALNTPWLWTYVGLGPDSSNAHWRCVTHEFEMCFARSRDRPMEICLDLADALPGRWNAISSVLECISTHTARWCIMLCKLPGAMILDRAFPNELPRLFTGDTPLLEELMACFEDYTLVNSWDRYAGGLPKFLPHCPRLRAMRTDRCHVVYTAPQAPLEALIRLELQVSLPMAVIWNMLELAPGLQHLDLDISEQPPTSEIRQWNLLSHSAVYLASLKSLCISGWAHELFSIWGASLAMPNLQKLVAFELFTHEIQPIVEQCARSVRSLHWQPCTTTELREVDAATLGQFTNVEELILCENFSPEFIAAATHLWPKLETLMFSHGNPTIAATEALLEFVRARRRDATARLRTVALEDYMIPRPMEKRMNEMWELFPIS